MFLYATCGFFGASLFGASTAGNIMVNDFVPSTLGCLVLYGGMLLYVCFGNAVAQYPLRASVDLLLVGERPMTPARSVSWAGGVRWLASVPVVKGVGCGCTCLAMWHAVAQCPLRGAVDGSDALLVHAKWWPSGFVSGCADGAPGRLG